MDETKATSTTTIDAGDIQRILTDSLRDYGKDLHMNFASVAAYLAERTAHLQQHSASPDFAEMVRVERDNALLKAGLAAVSSADAADQRVIGLIHGILFTAASLAIPTQRA